tara:strand:+ start:131 stop:355 length:225 start_codon:yes stop_codon:yes gene_type:complete
MQLCWVRLSVSPHLSRQLAEGWALGALGFYKRARRKIITNPVKIALIIINKPGQSTIGSSYLGTRGSIYSLGGS